MPRAALLLPLIAALTAGGPVRDDGRPVSPRIVRGDDAPPYEYNWVVSILVDGGFLCGGSLLSAQHVLTAAHCIEEEDGNKQDQPWRFLVGVFQHDRSGSSSHPLGCSEHLLAERIAMHPRYHLDTTSTADLAVIKLSAPVRCAENISYPQLLGDDVGHISDDDDDDAEDLADGIPDYVLHYLPELHGYEQTEPSKRQKVS